jgi:carnitine-CoA ligase
MGGVCNWTEYPRNLGDAAPILCLARPEFVDRIRDIRPDLNRAQIATTIDRIPLGPDDVTYNCHPMFHVTGRSPLITMCSTGTGRRLVPPPSRQ